LLQLQGVDVGYQIKSSNISADEKSGGKETYTVNIEISNETISPPFHILGNLFEGYNMSYNIEIIQNKNGLNQTSKPF